MLLIVMSLLSSPTARAGLVFNEIHADPSEDASCDGAIDTVGDEFVEIVNLGPGAVDLLDATLSDAQSVRHTFGPLVLQEGDVVVLFGGDPVVFDGTGPHPWCVDAGPGVTVISTGTLSLNNGGDDLILAASDGTLLASVSYPSTAGDDQSLVLSPELHGTSYVKHLTVSAYTSSPGRAVDGSLLDPGAGPGCTLASEASVVLNELYVDAPGADAGLEWVELYGGGGEAVILDGWRIAAGASVYSEGEPLPAGVALEPGEHLVIGEAPLAQIDVVARLPSLGNASGSADAVQLLDCAKGVVDTIVYGSPNSDGWLDDQGLVATSLAPAPPEGGSLARTPDGLDTDLSGDDLLAVAWPSPGEPNDPPPGGCGGPGSGVVINEILPDPEGVDADLEWVELFHGGGAPVELQGWVLQAGTSGFGPVHTFGARWLEPGERLLLGGAGVPGVDETIALSLGNGGNADGVRLVDCAGLPADTLIYGSPNDGDPPFVDDSGQIAESLAPTPGAGAALQRVIDGYDTDQSAIDWVVTLEPTPGSPNPEHEPVVCVQSTDQVSINEILPDPEGEDGGQEFVELYNRGGDDASVAGWSLSVGTQGFEGRQVVIGGGHSVPAGGFLVIGGFAVPEADLVVPLSLGNGTGTDGIRLIDCAGGAVDTVLYGSSPNEDGLEDDQGSIVEPYGDPTSGRSLARGRDGLDTDTATDWVIKGRPSPGSSNEVALQPGDDPIGGGCSSPGAPREPGTGPEVQDPQGGCSTRPGAPLLLGLLGLGLGRRGSTCSRAR